MENVEKWRGYSNLTIGCAIMTVGMHFYSIGVAFGIGIIAIIIGLVSIVFTALEKGKYLKTIVGLVIAITYVSYFLYTSHQYELERQEILERLEY